MQDAETASMIKLVEVFKDLDKEATIRVLRWAYERFGAQQGASSTMPQSRLEQPVRRDSEFPDLPSLYDAARPSTQGEKAMAVAYWIQVVGGQEDWDSQSVNSELKNLGDGLKNVTDALNGVIEQSPRLVIQTRKTGPSKQARKRYKLTVEGIKRVRAMLSQNRASSNDQ